MLTDQQVKVLAAAMTSDGEFTPGFNAGYTYLGQFISHDIVPETRRLSGGRLVRPFLNLDSLYTRPGAIFSDDDRFVLTAGGPNTPVDLPRIKGVALIPERRNDENIIVAQLHVLWLRFHNLLVIRKLALSVHEARRMVTLVFQLLVVEDYLRQVLKPSVFNSYFRCNERWLGLSPNTIPREFALAAFRFGHSMVRASYDLKRAGDVALQALFRPNQALDPMREVDFTKLFGWPRESVQQAMQIDTNITPAMADIPVPKHGSINIVETNLWANTASGLGSGLAYVQELLSASNGAALAATFKLAALDKLGTPLAERLPLQANIGIENLPLWPYVLLEAKRQANGRGLGVLGSLICAEVLANAIVHAEQSIYPSGRWIPIDDVLATLGPLGGAIQKVRQAHRAAFESAADPRALCVRHVIELIDHPDTYL